MAIPNPGQSLFVEKIAEIEPLLSENQKQQLWDQINCFLADCHCSSEVRPYHFQKIESKHSSTESEYTLDEKEDQNTKIADVSEDMTREASSSLGSSEESDVAPPKVITLLEGSCLLIAKLKTFTENQDS